MRTGLKVRELKLILMKKNSPSIIVDSEIVLRTPQQRWAQIIYEIINQQRNYLAEWLPWVDKTTSEQYIRTFLRESILFNGGGQRFTTFIFYKRQIVGSIGFVRIVKAQECGEIGYWLHRDFQGKGIMTKSCQALVNYGFQQLELQRIEIRILVGNQRSMSVPLRAGFQYEGTLRAGAKLRERFYDVKLFSVIRSDWLRENGG